MLWPPGADSWTTVIEHGLQLSLDVTQSIFSSGNGTEKQRMARLPAAGETVVDLFAGIGYWTIPLLVHARVSHVHACEWNPPSIDALKANLALNGISASACTVLAGDCREMAPHRVAHRVMLGLLPDAACGYAVALAALRPDTGGVLHVHGCVRAGEQDAWGCGVAKELQTLLLASGNTSWTTRVLHVEVVKSYAPRVLHCVADIKVGPAVSTSIAQQAPLAQSPPQLLHLHAPCAAHVHATAVSTRTPAHLTGLDVGPCSSLWSLHHLQHHADADVPVTVHVGDSPHLNWHPTKNFTLRNMPLRELLAMCHQRVGHFVYMRAVGSDPRTEPACLATSFPSLSTEVQLPLCCMPPAGRDTHSTVLRIASPGLALWLHYDALDNCLVQLCGRKRVKLFPPSAASGLYLSGSSSRVPTSCVWADDSDEGCHAAIATHFPRFAAAKAACVEVCLNPGEALVIPRYWAHSVLADDDLSVAVNCFWHPPVGEPRANDDVYGNADPPAATQALQAARAMAAALAQLPPDAQKFYASVATGILGQEP